MYCSKKERKKKEIKKENNVSGAADDEDGRHLGFGNEFTKTESAKRKQKCPCFFLHFDLLSEIPVQPVDCVKETT